MNPRYHSTGGVQLALAIYDQKTFLNIQLRVRADRPKYVFLPILNNFGFS